MKTSLMRDSKLSSMILIPRSRRWWRVAGQHYTTILLVAVILMALVALPWLTLNVAKLLWEERPWGAMDLKYRYHEVQRWFAGQPVYHEYPQAMHAVYPPASYTML
jgi:hypothetical protein